MAPTRSPIRRALGPSRIDALIAVVLAGISLGALFTGEGIGPRHSADALGVVLVLGSTLPLAWRRRWPLEVLLGLGAASGLYAGLGYPDGPTSVAVLVAVFGVASAFPAKRSLVAVAVVAVGGAVISALPPQPDAGSSTFWVVVCVAAWSLGAQIRHRRLRREALAAEAEHAERERELLTERAVAEERLRIARELHDVVAHGVSVMVVQAGAARTVLETDPERASGALRAVEDTGRHALVEMRRLLGLLRSGTGEATGRAPLPGVEEIPELVRASEAAGVPTTLAMGGVPDDLPSGVGLTAYRIVQEALTNVRRHAGAGARATVRVESDAETVRVVVEDDGVGPGEEVRPGHGLVGMRERVAALGGEVEVAPRAGGGTRVSARIPLREAALA